MDNFTGMLKMSEAPQHQRYLNLNSDVFQAHEIVQLIITSLLHKFAHSVCPIMLGKQENMTKVSWRHYTLLIFRTMSLTAGHNFYKYYHLKQYYTFFLFLAAVVWFRLLIFFSRRKLVDLKLILLKSEITLILSMNYRVDFALLLYK